MPNQTLLTSISFFHSSLFTLFFVPPFRFFLTRSGKVKNKVNHNKGKDASESDGYDTLYQFLIFASGNLEIVKYHGTKELIVIVTIFVVFLREK